MALTSNVTRCDSNERPELNLCLLVFPTFWNFILAIPLHVMQYKISQSLLPLPIGENGFFFLILYAALTFAFKFQLFFASSDFLCKKKSPARIPPKKRGGYGPWEKTHWAHKKPYICTIAHWNTGEMESNLSEREIQGCLESKPSNFFLATYTKSLSGRPESRPNPVAGLRTWI